jgi:apolipoprotein N-acyltransferase
MTKKISLSNKLDLVIWPETAIPFYIKQPTHSEELQTINSSIDSLGLNLISGASDLKIYQTGETVPPSSKKSKFSDLAYDSYNSVFFFQPNTEKIQVYHKIRLVPFSERIPYLDTYPFLVNFLEWGVGISNWGIGKDSTIFSFRKNQYEYRSLDQSVDSVSLARKSDSDTIKFWSMICYESIFPGFVSEFVNKGAQFLVIITNDSWFGNSSGPYQHNQIAILRAIENRRAIARCANGGISSIIDPTGRVIAKTKFMTKDYLTGEIEINSEKTFYSLYGDLFAKVCLYIALVFIIGAYFEKIFKIKTKFFRSKNE